MRGNHGQFTVTNAALARRMHDAPLLGGTGVGADFPLPGGGGEQQRARRRPGHAQALVLQRHAGTAAGGEDLPDRVNVGFEERIFRRDHLHRHRVDVQLLGYARGQRGVRAGAGIVLVHHQFHRAVGQDAHPGIGFEVTGRRRGLGVCRRQAAGQVKRDGQAAGSGGALLEKRTPREVHLGDRHHASFGALAARLIALLIRP
ncbi:hypothetical protein D3C76_1275250 [compost metagenome]